MSKFGFNIFPLLNVKFYFIRISIFDICHRNKRNLKAIFYVIFGIDLKNGSPSHPLPSPRYVKGYLLVNTFYGSFVELLVI